jgi:hypothetical protein
MELNAARDYGHMRKLPPGKGMGVSVPIVLGKTKTGAEWSNKTDACVVTVGRELVGMSL